MSADWIVRSSTEAEMTQDVAILETIGTWFWGALVVTLGCSLLLITLIVSYDILFGLDLGWTASAILAIVVFWGVVLLWGPMILLIFSVMLSLFAKVSGLSTSRVRIPGQNVATLGS
jgi:hypothetical protein